VQKSREYVQEEKLSLNKGLRANVSTVGLFTNKYIAWITNKILLQITQQEFKKH